MHQMVTGHGGQRVLVYGNEEEDVNEEEADGEEDVDVVQHWEQAFQGMRSAVLDVEVRDKIQVWRQIEERNLKTVVKETYVRT